MFDIKNRENLIVSFVERAKIEKKKIYLYGCAEMGKMMAQYLINHNLDFFAFCVDTPYYTSGTVIMGHQVIDLTEICEEEKSVVIVCVRDVQETKVIELKKKAEVLNCDSLFMFSVDGKELSYDYFEEKKESFEAFYEQLVDEKSRAVMEAYINQKVSADMSFLKELFENNQYYVSGLYDYRCIESIVDCGAYDGDSYIAFKRRYEEETGKEYEGESFLFEPDKESYKKLQNVCALDSKSKAFNVGTWNEKDVLHFNMSNTTSSGIDSNGEIEIEVNSLDNILGERKVDLIKMDVEGAEYKSIEGARGVIEKNHPVLAICVYHKRDDLIAIPQLIKEIDSTYRFYLRSHNNYSQELVLYAI